jgi:hypothetical protein
MSTPHAAATTATNMHRYRLMPRQQAALHPSRYSIGDDPRCPRNEKIGDNLFHNRYQKIEHEDTYASIQQKRTAVVIRDPPQFCREAYPH